MNISAFWAIVASSRDQFDPALRDGNMARQVERLRVVLRSLSADDVAEFDRLLDDRVHAAYRWDLWGAAYVIGGGCSDDGFTDFRGWLISMGREVYEAALGDPESLLDVADAPGVEVASFEEFLYVPSEVYEELTGQDMPERSSTHPPEPAGEPWSEDGDDLARRFPRLWAKYGAK